MAKGGNGGGGGKGGGKPNINPFYAAHLRHYIPFNHGTLTLTTSDTVIKNYGQWKFNPQKPVTMGGVSVLPATGSLLYGGKPAICAVQSDATGLTMSTPTSAGENLGKQQTIGGWFRLTNALDYRTMVCKGSGSNDNFRLYANVTTGVVVYVIGVAGVNKILTGVTGLPTTNPMALVVATYDGVAQKIYINGRLDASRAETGTPDTGAEDICIGHRNEGGSQRFWGSYAHIFIMNRALNHGEILRLAAHGPAAFEVPDALFPPNGPEPPAPPAPPGGAGSTGAGTGSTLGGVTNVGSMHIGGVIPGGYGPQDGYYHRPSA